MRARWLNLTFCLILSTSTASGNDWPQWRGPQRNGISEETGLLKEWPKDGPKLIWHSKDVGNGYSTPSILGNRVFIQSNTDMENEFVQALDARDGRKVWSTRLGKVGINHGPQYPGARSTPTIDGDLVFALDSDGDLACLEAATGKVLWKKSLHSEFAGRPGYWAYAESPLADGDVVVATPGGKKVSLVALNKKTGEVIWKSLVSDGGDAAYASAIVVEVGGVKQYVQFLAKGVVGLDAKTGRCLWRYDETAKSGMANIPTPVARGRFVYSASGAGGGALVELKAAAGAVRAEPVYVNKKLPNRIGGAVLVGDYLYGTTGRGLMCVAFKDGKVAWENKCVGPGSICYADGCLYVHAENTGAVALVQATPERYQEMGRFIPLGQPDYSKSGSGLRAWEYPVVANGRLYVRDVGSLWCYDIKTAQRTVKGDGYVSPNHVGSVSRLGNDQLGPGRQ
jgi:outer membrane protein assembly factor BamB